MDAYHDTHQSPAIDSLPLKSGALQGAIVIDYPFDHRFESIHIVYDGINGQLPNLDLLNTVVSIASGQMGKAYSYLNLLSSVGAQGWHLSQEQLARWRIHGRLLKEFISYMILFSWTAEGSANLL